MLTAAWLVWALATGMLVAGACLAADGLARARQRPARWIWAAGLAAMPLLGARSIVTLRAERRSVHLPAAVAVSGGASAAPVAAGPLATLSGLLDAGSRALTTMLARAAGILSPVLGHAAPALWLLVTAMAILTIAAVHLRIARLRRRWPSARLLDHDVRVAPAVGPAVLGVVQPFIVVPRWLLARTAAEQRLVLAHESEHLAAHDHLLLAAATLVVALVPWHPAAWWMLSRLRLSLELDCDARVLRRGVPARTYGSLLIDLAGHCSSFTAGATALADESSHLHRRLLAMTPIPSRFVRVRAGALAAVAGVAILAACEAKVPTSADVENMDVASAERGASSIGLVANDANTTYFVDGVQTDAATARAIPKNHIATIDVRKANGSGEIRIATLQNGGVAARPGVHVTIIEHDSAGTKWKSDGALRPEHDRARDKMSFAGVIYIDGVRADDVALQALDPKSIVSMEVIKGARASQESSDPAAVNGVIRVTTRAGAAKQ